MRDGWIGPEGNPKMKGVVVMTAPLPAPLTKDPEIEENPASSISMKEESIVGFQHTRMLGIVLSYIVLYVTLY